MANTPGSTPALIFIPDISGFTRFVRDVEIEHSGHIIRELLETIIDANTIGLEVSEIEGDAVLFYRMGGSPGAAEVLGQVQSMYEKFHLHLKRYAQTRICHCGACITAHKLELKFVAHFGQLTTNKVKGFTKLFGTDLIVAHRLLKNQIGLDEYLLLTKSYADSLHDWQDHASTLWADVQFGTEHYDLGDVDYLYVPLTPLQANIPEPELNSYTLDSGATEMFRNVAVLNAPLELVFDVMSDVGFRHRWQLGIKDSTELSGAITHEGSTHRCVINGTDSDPFQVSHDFEASKGVVTWVDSDIIHHIDNVIQLEKIAPAQTKVTMIAYANFGWIKTFFAKLFIARKFKSGNDKSLASLNTYLEKLVSKGEGHSSQVVLWAE